MHVRSELIQGSVIAELRKLAEKKVTVQAIVTSYPYYKCRPYPVEDVLWEEISYSVMAGLPALTVEPWSGQLGHEFDLIAYVGHVVAICREAKRVLHDRGSMLLNFGDVYHTYGTIRESSSDKIGYTDRQVRREMNDPLQNKDLCMVPFRVALALQADGWIVRSIFPWYKPDGMTDGRAGDRPMINHEHWILLTKQSRYYWDPHISNIYGLKTTGDWWLESMSGAMVNQYDVPLAVTANTGKSDFHSAPYSESLVEPLIRSATSDHGVCPVCGEQWRRVVEKQKANKKAPVQVRTLSWAPSCSHVNEKPIPATVLDYFAGSCTTLKTAMECGRNAIGVELSEEYYQKGLERLEGAIAKDLRQEGAAQLPLFSE